MYPSPPRGVLGLYWIQSKLQLMRSLLCAKRGRENVTCRSSYDACKGHRNLKLFQMREIYQSNCNLLSPTDAQIATPVAVTKFNSEAKEPKWDTFHLAAWRHITDQCACIPISFLEAWFFRFLPLIPVIHLAVLSALVLVLVRLLTESL